ncbi:MAG: phospho-N-acetylmuramoyl-pentapeptide-transferase [Actinobacteria bacterium]|nr:phospho-N-acetylmuramoyl-pentapeptide-transferase [Actinomycetota bacterium]
MVRVLFAGILAMVISIAVGPKFIAFLRRREYGQHIREEGPSHHVAKQGTPTMGGVLILLSMSIPYLFLSRFSTPALTVFFVTLGCGAVGFADDFTKLTRKRSLGLSGRWKLLLLAGITAVVAWVTHHRSFETSVYLPVVDAELPLSWAWYGLLFLIIAGASNGANLTDGLDGLAAGIGMIAVFTFTAMNVLGYIRSGPVGARSEVILDQAILGAALVGAILGFLWYNAFPAEVFMGDTGSMAIGGALASFAIVGKTEFLLILVGGIFLIEALSVMVQVFGFKYFGRRLFLMAPIHHHFEMKGWSETRIMVRFWILGAILCALAFVLYYRYYFRFFRG